MSKVACPTIRVQNPSLPSYLRGDWVKLEKVESDLLARENKLRVQRSLHARERYDLTVLSKVAEPTTEHNRVEKGRAFLQVVEIIEDLDLGAIAILEARKYLGVPHLKVREMMRRGELQTYEYDGVQYITVESLTNTLIKSAEDLGVHPRPNAG